MVVAKQVTKPVAKQVTKPVAKPVKKTDTGRNWSEWSNDDKNSFVFLVSTNPEFRQSVYEKIKTDQDFKSGFTKEIIKDQDFRTAVVKSLGSESTLKTEIIQSIKADPTFLEMIKGSGAQGMPGPKGDSGIQGMPGLKGDSGIQGMPGLKGDSGIQGMPGLKGDNGIQGMPGPKGDNGIQGMPGPKGDIGPQGPPGDVSKQFLKESTLWCADGGLCTLPKGKNGIDWGYGGSKIYDEGQLIIESDDNIYFKTWNKDTLLLNKEGAMISNPDQKSYTTLGIGGGYIFRNGVDRAEDGGGGTMTVRNDKGNLRLMATGGTVFAQDRNILAELDQLKAKTVNIAYTQRPFVQYSANGTDLANQPIRQTVVGCQDACNANPACIGFSRGKGVADTVVDNCWLKQAYPNPVFNDNSYQTFVKPGAIYPQS